MRQQKRAVRGKMMQRFAQIDFRDIRKFIDSGRNEETLEAEDSFRDKRTDFFRISRNNAAPKSCIDPTLSGCGLDFRTKGVNSRRRWNAVERHVDDGRDSACRGR